MRPDAVLEVDRLAKHFPVSRGFLVSRRVGVVKAVDGVSFTIRAGETLALVGESGCGKSTTGRLALRLMEPTAGTVLFEGEDLAKATPARLRALRSRMQLVFQDPYASLNPRMTVGQTLAEPMRLHGIAHGRAAADRVAELLALVGLPTTAADRHPHAFSGGQRQRIGIARALAAGPKLIVADEPVSALDVSIRAQVVNLMEGLKDRFGLAYLFISHDLGVVRHMADRVAVMYFGRIVEIGPKAALFAQPRHPYTRALLASVLEPGRRDEGALRTALPGDVPSPLAPPGGCHFHPRCRFADDRCRTVEPVLDSGDGHGVACHLWQDLPHHQPIGRPSPPRPLAARLARLQTAFRRPVTTGATTLSVPEQEHGGSETR